MKERSEQRLNSKMKTKVSKNSFLKVSKNNVKSEKGRKKKVKNSTK